MRLEELRQIFKDRLSKGESHRKIGKDYGIFGATVSAIVNGQKVGRVLSKRLKLDPSARLVYTRQRREMLNEIANKHFRMESWSAYETYLIMNWED